jgi:hypothetical protein
MSIVPNTLSTLLNRTTLEPYTNDATSQQPNFPCLSKNYGSVVYVLIVGSNSTNGSQG